MKGVGIILKAFVTVTMISVGAALIGASLLCAVRIYTIAQMGATGLAQYVARDAACAAVGGGLIALCYWIVKRFNW